MASAVERLSVRDREEAVAVLASAFRDYPVMRYVLSDASARSYAERLDVLIGFLCDKRLTRDWPLLGVRDGGGRLCAVAGINLPADATVPPALEASIAKLRDGIGAEAVARLDAYEDESDLDAPPERHHFLGIIGTRPECRGSGYGRTLIEEVAALAAADAESAGVCLNTESAANVPYYESHGFRVIAERDIGAIHTWCMFRSTRSPAG